MSRLRQRLAWSAVLVIAFESWADDALFQTMPLLEVIDLVSGFETDSGFLRAVDGISFQLEKGKTLGIVGESGCGKSVTALSIMRLISTPPGKVLAGQIKFEGTNLLELPESRMRNLRGNAISMIFQEPMTSLNPVFTIGFQIAEAIALHQKDLSNQEVKTRTIEMLSLVGISEPARRFDSYPHELSGGMRQRVMIAMALSCRPKILIADEPTTALDVTIQAQILDLIQRLQKEFSSALLLITHDLGVVAEVCDQVAVMYAGKIVESGSVLEIFSRPQHPYTRGLLDSIPTFINGNKKERLNTIPGMVPDLQNLPNGCRYFDRCLRRTDHCLQIEPELRPYAENTLQTHLVACHNNLG